MSIKAFLLDKTVLGTLKLISLIAAVSVLPFSLSNASDFDLADAPRGTYLLDKTHGYITFSYSHQGYSKPWLRFRSLDATLDLNKDAIEQSTLEVNVDPGSIDSGVDIFDEHLLGKNHFNVAKYPNISFIATEISVEGNSVSVTGDLSIKDRKAPIVLTGTFNRGGLHFQSKKPTLGFSATTQLKRSEWGLGYAVPIVGDDVEVLIEVEFNRVEPLARVKGLPVNQ